MSTAADRSAHTVVIPSLGRPSLQRLLDTLADQYPGPGTGGPLEVIVVDDRADASSGPLRLVLPLDWTLRVVRGFGRGPAAARNLGWRLSRTGWVVFLDDDVELPPGWGEALARDLSDCGPDDGATQARLEVPLPTDRRPTDWERNTAGLQDAAWATADMAYRRAALEQVAGFDERFPRAYREDADLALRVRRAGWKLRRGQRRTLHPVRPANNGISVRVQRGNADDVLMRRLHGPDWRAEAEVPRGRLRWHVATVTAALAVALALLAGRRRPAALAASTWAVLSADFARRRIAPGPGLEQPAGRAEAVRMLWTSAVIPWAALRHRLRAQWQHRRAVPAWPVPVRAVLFDRDGTLVHDVPYNGDPALVKPVDDAAAAVAAVRAAGLATGVVTNQSGIARGLLTRDQVNAVNARVEELLGPFGVWQVCPHQDGDGCGCRKPAPGMILAAASRLGLQPGECAVIGDIGADLEAARAAGARAILVPNASTRQQEIDDAPLVCATLLEAVETLLGAAHEPVVGARR